MANRGKNFKPMSPKKVSWRRRTPRCDSCGKRDGEEIGEEGRKIRLKLCARCRGVVYCGMGCQKAAWKQHREVCVQYVNPADLPPQSPLVGQQKIAGADSRGRRKVNPGSVTATPTRQREIPPTRHPFFGRQESMDRHSRAAAAAAAAAATTATPPAAAIATAPPSPPEQTLIARKRREQEQDQQGLQQPRQQQDGQKDDICPTPPPTMQRLSMPISNTRSRYGSRFSNSSARNKGLPTGSRNSPPQQNQSGGTKAMAEASKRMTTTRDKGSANTTLGPSPRRASSGSASPQSRWNTHTSANGMRPQSSSASPPKPPTYEAAVAGKAAFVSSRRQTAPPYPVGQGKIRRPRVNSTGSSAVDVGKKGPPPPYGSIARRAKSLSQGSPPPAVSKMGTGSPSLPETDDKVRGTTSGAGLTTIPTKEEAQAQPPVRSPLPTLPPRTVSSDATSKPSLKSPPPLPPRTAIIVANASSPEKATLPKKSPSDQIVSDGAATSRSLVPKQQCEKRVSPHELTAAREKYAEVPPEPAPKEEVTPKKKEVTPKKKDAPFESGGSSGQRGEGGDCNVDVVGPLEENEMKDSPKSANSASRGAEPEGECTDAPRKELGANVDVIGPLEENEMKDSPKSAKSKCREAEPEGECTDAPRKELGATQEIVETKDSANEPLDFLAHVSEAPRQGSGATVDSPPPIMTSLLSSSRGAANSTTTSHTGLFASCPPSGYGTGRQGGVGKVSKPPPMRSMSAGTVARFTTQPLAVGPKGMSTSVVAARRGAHRSSPRLRPPSSPGPAALFQSSRKKPFTVFQEGLTEEEGIEALLAAMAPLESAPTPAEGGQAPASLPIRSSFSSEGSMFEQTTQARVRSATVGDVVSSRSHPFIPAFELSPLVKPPTPQSPGPRPTATAIFYQQLPGEPSAVGLPPPSKSYLSRPGGFSVHVLVAAAPTAADLMACAEVFPVPRNSSSSGCIQAGSFTRPSPNKKKKKTHISSAGGKDHHRWLYYSFDDRARLAGALKHGDIVLLAPGRFEARAWGLQHLVSSVEIIGTGNSASACVVYNDFAPSYPPGPKSEHYLVGVMGGAMSGLEGEKEAPKGDFDVDSDSGFEDGTVDPPASSKGSFDGRAVRVRLANLTLEQRSGYRGAVYQLGCESHLEMDGCIVRCAQGGVNIDQGTCLICDSTISGSEVFGVHIGGEGAVEHCSIIDCGRGGRGGGEAAISAGISTFTGGGFGANESNDVARKEEDDGTDVNRLEGMPAVSVLQSSSVRVRFNVIKDNAGHALQCRDTPLPAGDTKSSILARRAEAEAEENLRAWLGSAAVLLKEHLQEQCREGSIVAEGNQCQHNRRCTAANCASVCAEVGGAEYRTSPHPVRVGEDNEAGAEADIGMGAVQALEHEATNTVSIAAGNGGITRNEERERETTGNTKSGTTITSAAGMAVYNRGGAGQTCVPTAEEEGLPLPAGMALRFLAAMDEGYIGSRREENARAKRRRVAGGGGAG